MKIILFLLVLLTGPFASGASPEPSYRFKSGELRFAIGYTGGTHEGTSKVVEGRELLGTYRVPVTSLSTENRKRDCHLYESLGLDYAKSGYPEEHVCENDKLPESGPNALAFPAIEFKAERIRPAEAGGKLDLTRHGSIVVEGQWTLHGVTRKGEVTAKVSPTDDGFRAQGEAVFVLADYGIVVKSAKVLFLEIKVMEKATVSLDLRFARN